ncbi:MAG: YceI family protein [Pseudomonadales bacterium]
MRLPVALLTTLLFLPGCAESDNAANSNNASGGNDVTAKQSAAASAVENGAGIADAAAGVYHLDKTHGYVTFSYSHQGYSRPWLRFRDVDATLQLDPADISQSKLQVNIDASSIDSGVDIFDEHLRGDKFFDVAKYPAIEYVATDVTTGAKANTLSIAGILTMKGVARPLALEATFNKSGLHFKTKKPQLGFSAKALLKRSEWDLGYGVPMVGDDVEVIIEAEFMQP